MFAALEAALVLKLDAQMRCPTVGLTTTTRDPEFTLEDLRQAEQALWRQLRREAERTGGERIEYAGFLEWTTGEGSRAGGHRRPHLHHLVKGIPADDRRLELVTGPDGRQVPELELHVSELWRRYTGDAWIVEARPLRTPAGCIAYLALHHHKRAQSPPPNMKRHVRRLRPSKGYYERPIAELRELARRLAAHERCVIAAKRAIAAELHGRDEYDADADLTAAIVGALRSMASGPPELQVDLAGEVDYDAEHAEFVDRAVGELERIRREAPPELVFVREREVVNKETGAAVREAVAVIGAVAVRKAA